MNKTRFWINKDKDLEWQGKNLERRRDSMLFHHSNVNSKYRPSTSDIAEIDKVCNKIWTMLRLNQNKGS